MSVFGIDHAWGVPSSAALRNAHVKFVVRYLSHDASKNLTRKEADHRSADGIDLAVIWETTANRAMSGRAGGAADATEAAKQAKACGMPPGRPIYFAVDWDAQLSEQPAINAYLDGAASVLGGPHRVGIYGGFGPVARAMAGGHAAYGWQTYAWSRGKWYGPAQLQQYLNGQRIGGVDCDYNRAMNSDFGQWRVGVSPAPPTPAPNPQEDDMPYGQLAEGRLAVTPIALPKGKYKTIGFVGDNGLQKLPPSALRVAVHQGGGVWKLFTPTVDSSKGQAVVTFPTPATTDGISVRREDAGDVHVAWEVS